MAGGRGQELPRDPDLHLWTQEHLELTKHQVRLELERLRPKDPPEQQQKLRPRDHLLRLLEETRDP